MACQLKKWQPKTYYVIEEIEKERIVCCVGYSLIDNSTCKPVCETPCVTAECVAPNICRCYEYFGGHSCEIGKN